MKISVPRNVVELARDAGDEPRATYEPISLESVRDVHAYVLLGDPGLGKTTSFTQEAEALGTELISARNFIDFPQTRERWEGKILFIDALDETRAGLHNGQTVLGTIRSKLSDLGVPRFRLSCREQDWLRNSDSEALEYLVKGVGALRIFRLTELSDDNIQTLLKDVHGVSDPRQFVLQAEGLGLAPLLRNPQMLRVLANAVGNGEKWPQTKIEAFQFACEKLATEFNKKHQEAKQKAWPATPALLDAAGYLSAIYLCANRSAITLNSNADANALTIQEIANEASLPLSECLETNLFVGGGDNTAQPVHRSIAEYFGAKYIAKRIENGLSASRALALMTGGDGGVITSLRGLHAWLAACSPTARPHLIDTDPLGVLLYGDVQSFPVSDKKLLLRCLRRNAEEGRDQATADWTDHVYGALATPDMASEILQIMRASGRSRADQQLAFLVIRALSSGAILDGVTTTLLDVARDNSRDDVVRKYALRTHLKKYLNSPNDAIAFLDEISAGGIADADDELLGILLRYLYPKYLTVREALDHLHNPKNKRLLGSYQLLWRTELLNHPSTEQLPELLDALAERPLQLNNLGNDGFWTLANAALARGLSECGDTVDDERIYAWLGITLGEHDYDHLHNPEKEAVLAWLKERPERHKALLRLAFSRCADTVGFWRAHRRLHEAPIPDDFFAFLLDCAESESKARLADDLFLQAVHALLRKTSDGLESLDLLERWVIRHPQFDASYRKMLFCDIDDWRHEQAIRKAKDRSETQDRIKQYADVLCTQSPDALNVQGLHYLALGYVGRLTEAKGETPIDRLKDFLGNDAGLVSHALAALWATPTRADLPSAKKVLASFLNKKEWLLGAPLLVGLERAYETDPRALLAYPESTLKVGAMVSFVRPSGQKLLWRGYLAENRPKLYADVFAEYAVAALKAGDRSLNGVHDIASEAPYVAAARIAIPIVLDKFPRNALVDQLFDLERFIKGLLSIADARDALALVRAKLALKTLDVGQRTYWLGAGLLLVPHKFEKTIRKYVAQNEVRIGHLSRFLDQRDVGTGRIATLPTSSISLLIELFGPNCRPERPTDGGVYAVTPDMNRADLVRGWINKLGGSEQPDARDALIKLQAMPELHPWLLSLIHALAAQTVVMRDATFQFPSTNDVVVTLSKGRPANPADLFAIVTDELGTLIADIEHSDLDSYKQFWNVDSYNNPNRTSKPEESCRDLLTTLLRERLKKYGIGSDPEARHPNKKRSDIWCTYDGYGVPIEAKKDSHPDVWKALQNQLVEKYSRDRRANGYGIYLIFWVGGEKMKSPSSGKKPKTANELQLRLEEQVSDAQKAFIVVRVLDVSLRGSG